MISAPPSGKEIPEKSANFVSQALFTWLNPILALGWARTLQNEDLWEMDQERRASYLGSILEKNYFSRCPPHKRPSPVSPLPDGTLDALKDIEKSGEKGRHLHVPDGSKDDLSAYDFVADVNGVPALEKGEKSDLPTGGAGRFFSLFRRGRSAGSADRYDEDLVKALNETFFWTFWKSGVIKFIGDTLQSTSPLVTKALLAHLSRVYHHHKDPENTPQPAGIGYGIGLVILIYVMQQLSSFCTNAYTFQSMTTGFLARTSVISCIFRKSLRLSAKSRIKHSMGQITTIISTDASRLDLAASQFHLVWIGPVQILLSVALLIRNMGYSALVAVAVLLLAVPFQALVVRRMVAGRKAAVDITDKRVRLVQEILQGIRLLLLLGWQAPYTERVIGLRKEELGKIRNIAVYRALMLSFVHLIPILAAILCFVTYAMTGHALHAATVFSSLQYFNLIRSPLVMVPIALTSVGDAKVAIKRIAELLTAEEIEGDYPIERDSDMAVRVHGDFTWETAGPPEIKAKGKGSKEQDTEKDSRLSQDSEQSPQSTPAAFQLTNVHLEIPKGAFVAIVGKVGSGKSSLLQALSGEMRKTSGHVVFGGSVGYVAQHAWIQNLTLRENVVFGVGDDQGRFERAVRACALERDLEMLPDGERTEIGERGVNLSGGQKARVSLARAAYYDADIVLLDDPLSAVDSHVSKHIVDQCLLNGPMAGKTRILATHQLHVVPFVDYIYFMQDGRIAEQGTYAELIADGGDFARLIEEFGSMEEKETSEKGDSNEAKDGGVEGAGVAVAKKNGAALMSKEERSVGDLPWSIYVNYIRAAGSLSWAPTMMLFIALAQVFRVANTVALGFWSAESIPGFDRSDYMTLYAGFGIGQAVAIFAGSITFSYIGFCASLELFRRALKAVLGSPMSFFDTTPIGRIMSRLTKDIDTLDFQLPDAWFQFLQQGSSVFGTVGLVVWSYHWLGVMFPPLFLSFWFLLTYYRRTSREAQRMDSLLRSLLYASYTEALTGLSTIRAFREQARFIRVTDHNVDIGNRAYFLTIACQRWLGVRVDAMGNLVILAIGLASIFYGATTNPATLGVVLTYALSITSILNPLIRQLAKVESNMNVVERVLFYGDLPQEGAATTPDDPPPNWPASGRVEFKDVSLRYREGLPLVLSGLSFEIHPGEHVGVVGRTGAGKSSLLSALFRIVESLAGGKVEIDGVDIATMGLQTLREQLAIIPQDALLFEGTLRTNLDPTGKIPDDKLYAALRRVGMLKPGGPADVSPKRGRFDLDTEVRDDSFSAGEKQLIALCRALVKDARIIVLDEATACVDVETDSHVQRMIQQDFDQKTLLCIAHRLNTIAFYDRILVMDAGRMAEFDTPLALFDREDSIFRTMCNKASLTREDIIKIRAEAEAIKRVTCKTHRL
ncbi:hypothetical protein BOTBODRAFT_34790 [Botryobasidium botryosum FD-172 SS1]|uniref:Uncharacterized protein n=1 Tax=Botryobasidium botryosum (strain FD-172 SS1) TaxID=930990 RepID=A0A067MJW8_BOTB1|nr:hypothetical protein BOTBODRAFT_34790 [Botryobasidium botryosum FD-172 SS1]